MFKTTKKYIALLTLISFLSGCESFLDVNEDPNSPKEVSVDLLLPSSITSIAYVMGGKYQVLGGIWSQHYTQSLGAQQYRDIDSYDITSADFDDGQYGELYTGALKNLEEIKKLSAQEQSWRYYLIATVLQCYTYQILADIYNDVPFITALQGEEENVTPKFQNGQEIYDSLIFRIDYALTKDLDIEDTREPEDDDLIFGGEMDYWERFAKTLKLKIYLRQCNAREEISEQGITELFEDEETGFLNDYAAVSAFSDLSGKRHPFYETEIVAFGNNPNIVLSSTLHSYMEENGDFERLDLMFNPPANGGTHNGLPQGDFNSSEYPAGTNSSSFSKPHFEAGYPVILISAAESYFMQAEAIIRFGVESYSEAKKRYEEGVKNAFALYGLNDDYAKQFYQGGPYAFPSEGSPEEDFIKVISYQRWLTFVNFQGLEAFLERNRTHYPPKSPVPYDDEGNYEPGDFTVSVNSVVGSNLPKRLLYPDSEYNRNPENTPTLKPVWEKVWWDTSDD